MLFISLAFAVVGVAFTKSYEMYSVGMYKFSIVLALVSLASSAIGAVYFARQKTQTYQDGFVAGVREACKTLSKKEKKDVG